MVKWGLAAGLLILVAMPARAGFTLAPGVKDFAERFLNLLDAGNIAEAHGMLNPEVQVNFPERSLRRAGSVRGFTLKTRRTFVRLRSDRPAGKSAASGRTRTTPTTVVCFMENKAANFASVSYTAVTVSGNDVSGPMRIENFQTTPEPVAACR